MSALYLLVDHALRRPKVLHRRTVQARPTRCLCGHAIDTHRTVHGCPRCTCWRTHLREVRRG